MANLLSASFSRLKRDKAFYVILAATFLLSLMAMLQTAGTLNGLVEEGYARSLDRHFFGMGPFLPAAFAAFISLFVGTEHTEGTLRNKLIVGHSRRVVFLSNFLVCYAGSVALLAAWLLGALPGIWLYRPLDMGISGAAVYILVAVCFSASFTALFVGVSLLCSNRTLTLIYNLVLWVVLLLIGSAIFDRLCESEFQTPVALVNGALTLGDPKPNPLYLSGSLREFWQAVLEFDPMGQTILMSGGDIVNPYRQMVFSLVFTALTLLGGVGLFRKKDLK